MYAATAKGTIDGRLRAHPQITESKPNVATNSLNTCEAPDRTCVDTITMGSSNIACAANTPSTAPMTCPITLPGTVRQRTPPWDAAAIVTTGLKCAPEIGPKVR